MKLIFREIKEKASEKVCAIIHQEDSCECFSQISVILQTTWIFELACLLLVRLKITSLDLKYFWNLNLGEKR